MNEFRQLLVSVAAACSLLCAPGAWCKTGDMAAEYAHFVTFPDRKIGSIALVPVQADMFTVLRNENLHMQAAAAGSVKVPPGNGLYLFSNYDLASDTRLLKQYHANDLLGISFYKMPIEDDGLKNLSHLTGLQKLDLRYTDVTDAGLPYLANLTKLVHLDLSATMVKGPGLHSVSGMKNLLSFDVSKTNFDENWLKEIVPLKTLTYVYVRRCGLTNKSIDYFVKMPELGELDMSDNPHITAQAMVKLAGVASLRSLLVSRTGLRPQDFGVMKQLHNIQAISIGGPGFNQHVAAEWKKAMPKVKIELIEDSARTDVPMSVFRPLH